MAGHEGVDPCFWFLGGKISFKTATVYSLSGYNQSAVPNNDTVTMVWGSGRASATVQDP